MTAAFNLALLLLCVPIVHATGHDNATSAVPPVPAATCAPVATDAFAALAKQRIPGPPVCNISGNIQSWSSNDADILSFEEWKVVQQGIQNTSSGTSSQVQPTSTSTTDVERTEPLSATTATGSDAAVNDTTTANVSPLATPTVLPSIKDRYNFASTDCSARVQGSHKSARSPDAILSSKKDRYMLSPCSAKAQHVVVELCDDIRIDTVQLANFEFFSGVFKQVRVSVSTNGAEWEVAGEYEAKNIRGVQSFHPRAQLAGFYRYVRVDILSHYGNEYYCPVSLLRVYGLTQMEKFKQEIAEDEQQPSSVQIVDSVIPTAPTPSVTSSAADAQPTRASDAIPVSPKEFFEVSLRPTFDISEMESATTDSTSSRGVSATVTASSSAPMSSLQTGTGDASATLSEHTTVQASSPQPTSVPTADSSTAATPGSSQSTAASSSTTAVPVSSSSTSPTPPKASSTATANSGDSIYRTIMNRLASLEANSTLVVRFVEQQAISIRDAVRRLEEEVGRIDGVAKSQQTLLARTLDAIEKERAAQDAERTLLLNRVAALADEVVLEKRLGIAQLTLLVAVLLFLAVTRGSGGIHLPLNVPLSRSRTTSSLSHFTLPQRLRVTSDSLARYGPTSADSPQDRSIPFPNTDVPLTGSLRLRDKKKSHRSGSHTPRTASFATSESGAWTPRSSQGSIRLHLPSPLDREDVLASTSARQLGIPTSRTSPSVTTARRGLRRANSQTHAQTLFPSSKTVDDQMQGILSPGKMSAARRAHLHEVRRSPGRPALDSDGDPRPSRTLQDANTGLYSPEPTPPPDNGDADDAAWITETEVESDTAGAGSPLRSRPWSLEESPLARRRRQGVTVGTASVPGVDADLTPTPTVVAPVQ